MDILGYVILAILMAGVAFLFLMWVYKIITTFIDGIELTYSLITKRPILIYFHPFLKKLNQKQTQILIQQFTFYNRLNSTHKKYFRHRVATFIKHKNFIGKEDFKVTDEVEVLISATAIMLTFGFRDFLIKSIEHVVIYPTEYFSTINNVFHKGEYNVNLKTLVLSWDNFKEGFRIENDKVNLGIHEFAHAIHFNSIYQEDINSVLFVDTYSELRDLIASDDNLRNRLISSEYIRNYAFTNDIELLAVILETFIETPQAFKLQFPNIYSKVKQMLNFHFSGY